MKHGKWALALHGAIALLGWTIAFTTLARAQEHHAQGHADYSNWASQKTTNCCNNEDCGDLTADQWREVPTGKEIVIKGKWCPVKPEHYITKGKSPDWNKAHACVQQNTTYIDPCDALLCFSGIGSF